jgi:hypothetical protein
MYITVPNTFNRFIACRISLLLAATCFCAVTLTLSVKKNSTIKNNLGTERERMKNIFIRIEA